MRGASASVCTRDAPGRTRTHQDSTKTPKKRGANILNFRGGTQKKIVFFLGMRHVYLYITRTPYISDKIFFVSLQRQ